MKRLKRLFSMFLCAALLLQALPAVTIATDPADTDTVDLKTSAGLTPAGAFSSMVLTAALSSDKSKLNMSFNFALDDSYLQTTASGFLTDFLDSWPDPATVGTPAYQAALDAAAIADDVLPPVGFAFTCALNENVSLPDAALGNFDLVTKAGELVGTYTVARQGDKLLVTGTLSKVIYAGRTGVSASADLSLGVSSAGGNDPTVDLDVQNGEIEISVTFSNTGDPTTPPEDAYTLAKTVSHGDPSSPFVDYTITAAGKAPGSGGAPANVNGLTITDPIPAGLAVIGVDFNGVKLDPTAYTIDESGTLRYTIPAYVEGVQPALTSASLTVHTQLTGEKYGELIQNGSVAGPFENRAYLYGSDPAAPLATSEQVSTSFSGSFLGKNGERVGANGGRYLWTVTANTYLTGSGRVYLVDTIQGIDTTHMYERNGNNVDYMINGATSGSAVLTTSAISYEALTTADLDALTSNGSQSVYYTYDTNSDSTPDQAVMIIPLSGSVLNRPLTVTYFTDVVDRSSDNYQGRNLNNSAKMLWSGVDYAGPGTGFPGSFSYEINKTVTAAYDLIRKSAGGYDEATQTMTWNFTVNQGGKAMTGAVITDVLDDHSQAFASLTARRRSGSATGDYEAVPKDTSPSGGLYYTLTPDSTNHKTTLKIYLGDVAADELVDVRLGTKVVDPAILSQQPPQKGGNVGNVANNATLDASIGGTSVHLDAPADKDVTNTLLVKDPLDRSGNPGSGYDFTTHTLRWRITVNPNRIPLNNAVLTDDLPLGTTFGALTSVRRIGSGGTETAPTPEILAAVSAGNGDLTFSDGLTVTLTKTEGTDSGYSKDRETFTFSHATSDEFVFEFTTVVDEDFRDAKFKAKDAVPFTNVSGLTATVSDPTGVNAPSPVNVSDDARQTVSVPPVEKSGIYVKYDKDHPTQYGDGSLGPVDFAQWTILLNKDGVNMEGVTVTDDLKTWFELDAASLSIRAATAAADGTLTATGDDLKDEFSLTATTAGFSFTIPAAYARTPLVITFNTLVVDTASASDMKNTVSLSWSGGGGASSGDEGASGAHDFDAEQFATMTLAPFLRIFKTSTNSATDASGKPTFKLGGAEFTLTPMVKSGSDWVPDSAAAPKVQKSSAATGYASFFFLKKDVLYKLEETEAPAGYEKDSSVHYLVFKSDTNTETYPDGTLSPEGTAFSLSQVVKNRPLNAANGYSISLKKAADTGSVLPGVSFTLHSTDGGLQDRTEVTDGNGVLTFPNVDPGHYTISETTPAGFQPAGTINATVSLSGGVYTVSMSGTGLSGNAADGYVLTNRYIRGTVSLQKTDSVSGQPVSFAEFTVYAKDSDQPAAYLTESGTSGTYTLAAVNAAGDDALGTPVLNAYGDPLLNLQGTSYSLLSGEYEVAETTTPAGYLPDVGADGKPVRYAFTIAADGVNIAVTNGLNVFTNEPCGSIKGVKRTTEGQLLPGAVIGLFPKGTTSFTTANLFESKTAVSGSDGSFTLKDIPYGEYVVAELRAPSGYDRDSSTSYKVTVDQNTAAITADQSGRSIVFRNARTVVTPTTGTLVILKTSADGALAGFTFAVTDGNGYYQEFVTDGVGRITVAGLPFGTYTVSELNTGITVGRYRIPAAQTVDLAADGAVLHFHNELVNTPVSPTGPTSGPTTGPTTGPATSAPTSGATSAPTSGATSGSTSGATSAPTSGATSGSTSGSTSGVTSGATSGSTSGSTSGAATGSTSAPTSGSATGATSGAATGATSGSTSGGSGSGGGSAENASSASGPKTGRSESPFLWPFVFLLSLLGLSSSVVLLLKGRKKGRRGSR